MAPLNDGLKNKVPHRRLANTSKREKLTEHIAEKPQNMDVISTKTYLRTFIAIVHNKTPRKVVPAFVHSGALKTTEIEWRTCAVLNAQRLEGSEGANADRRLRNLTYE